MITKSDVSMIKRMKGKKILAAMKKIERIASYFSFSFIENSEFIDCTSIVGKLMGYPIENNTIKVTPADSLTFPELCDFLDLIFLNKNKHLG